MGIFQKTPEQIERKAAGVKTSGKLSYLDELKLKNYRSETLTDAEMRTLSSNGVHVDGSDNAWKSIQGEPAKEFSGQDCPFCGNDNVVPLGTNCKGFSAGKAIIGGAIAGPAGLLAGALGKGGKKTIWVCAKCGKQFTR